VDSHDLVKRSSDELDRLFASSPAGSIPEGEALGRAVLCAGSGGKLALWPRLLAWLAHAFCWQGKVFDPRTHTLVNRVSFASVRAIRAKVYPGESWVDGRPCTVIDYSQTSKLARKVRDEIRELEPGLHLGVIWWGRKRLGFFTLTRRYEVPSLVARRTTVAALLIALIAAVVLGRRFTSDVRAPLDRSDPDALFKYGSTGGERDAGLPLSLWKLLPELFPEYLPGQGFASLGFVYEPGHELPIGVSQRRVQGIERVFVNCAVCHCGTVRMSPDSPRQIVAGMPSNTVDLQGFQQFLTNCVLDERFTGDRIALEIEARHTDDWINRQLIRYVAIDRMRSRILFLRDRFQFLEREPPCGPGRFDTFNPPKVLMNFPMDGLPRAEHIGLCDFPSVWNQGKREGMWLHWDGNNNSVAERNRSASFGTARRRRRSTASPCSAAPIGIRPSIRRRASRSGCGTPRRRISARAHRSLEARARQAALRRVLRALPRREWERVRLHQGRRGRRDRHLEGQDRPLAARLLQRGSVRQPEPALRRLPDERFRHFRKTNGYANQPLDGLWLRAPVPAQRLGADAA
jgi:hypothetical protein